MKLLIALFDSAPPLVMITGWPIDSCKYKNLVPFLADHFQCYLLDSPDWGLTRWRSETDFTFLGQANTFGGCIQTLGIKDYYLIAHDTGATIARLIAAENGKRVLGFTILNT